MEKIDTNRAKMTQDKTDWKKVRNSSQTAADAEALKDLENPVLTNKKFVKSEKPANK